ncbi:SDR family NAD(P)-dependent oxidoreductase [Calothrix sp. 336/3]|uniref:SDR family NAD(P)-dependent oxidoreductase n=1 Tax=Calothrix sp. 336/3 TaxID=1337936 RepID=UPI0004E32C74|nr:SDR family NAD(P)-dependent oxidoreductase [Calothrix sp. 336/3]AKG24473.1 short-chain dehydrogenase [Calothrix sp. 336/3]
MTQLQGATVLITGASGGFGQQLTRQLLQAGSQLILTGTNQEILHQRVTEIQQEVKTGKVLACLPLDLSQAQGCENLYHQVKALDIPLDILINNAGIALYGRFDETPVEKWERLMQINLLTPMRLSSLFVTDMIARQKGHIVNISSLAGWSAIPGMAPYAASKFGLRGFSEGLWNDVKQYNVKVTTVYPFFSRTPILDVERFGTLAKDFQGIPDNIVTEPADIIRVTIQGIIDNKIHVFPDRSAKILHLLKRYFPPLHDRILNGFERK